MRIAVCAPQVPFARGGAEIFADDLVAELRARDHEVDLVTVPYKWYPGERVLSQAFLWRLLDLDEADGRTIDLVIATKFPSYAVRHARKVVWLLHQFRQAYELDRTELGQFGESAEDRATRRAVQRLDRVALGEARKIFATSRNVAERLERSTGLTAEVMPQVAGVDIVLVAQLIAAFAHRVIRGAPGDEPDLRDESDDKCGDATKQADDGQYVPSRFRGRLATLRNRHGGGGLPVTRGGRGKAGVGRHAGPFSGEGTTLTHRYTTRRDSLQGEKSHYLTFSGKVSVFPDRTAADLEVFFLSAQCGCNSLRHLTTPRARAELYRVGGYYPHPSPLPGGEGARPEGKSAG